MSNGLSIIMEIVLVDFPFIGSSIAHLEPELELFEVWEMMVWQIIITLITNFKQLPLLFKTAREEPKKGKSP